VKKFQVGDKVRVDFKPHYDDKSEWPVFESEIVAVNADHEVPYKVADTRPGQHPISLITVYEHELELIEEEKVVDGVRVKATLGDSVIYGRRIDRGEDETIGVFPDGAKWHVWLGPQWSIEVISEPIVLPTGRYALIQARGAIYILTSDDQWVLAWVNTSHSVVRSPEEMLAYANVEPERYRVIFEGEPIDPETGKD
jgi:hypothetical protein